MACGLPVISTAWSAQTEFFNDEVGYPIKVKGLVPATARGAYYEGFQWADPDVDHLAALMRRSTRTGGGQGEGPRRVRRGTREVDLDGRRGAHQEAPR